MPFLRRSIVDGLHTLPILVSHDLGESMVWVVGNGECGAVFTIRSFILWESSFRAERTGPMLFGHVDTFEALFEFERELENAISIKFS